MNGVNGRLPRLLDWLAHSRPDVACLQEIKTGDATFPRRRSRRPATAPCGTASARTTASRCSRAATRRRELGRGLLGDDADGQARWLEAEAFGLRIVSVYLPNGNPQPGPKFDYKLAWFERLVAHARGLLADGVDTVLAGDFNVVPTNADIYNAGSWRFDAVLQPETRAAWQRLIGQGWVDATRRLHPTERIYTFWVNAAAHARNAGFRMDMLLLSPVLAQRLVRDGVDAAERGRPKASDHAPVWIELAAR